MPFRLLAVLLGLLSACEGPTAKTAADATKPGTGTAEATGDPNTSAAAEVARAVGLFSDEQEGGRLALFDHESLFGWKTDEAKNDWRVVDGAIVCDNGEAECLFSAVPFADFELTCTFRIDEGGNSGVFIRSTLDPQNLPDDALEVNICAEHPDGYTTGSVVELAESLPVTPGDDGGWHTLKIRCSGSRVETRVDGERSTELTLGPDAPASGLVGLQYREGAVAFRDVQLVPLNLESLLPDGDGRPTLDAWETVAQRGKDGEIAEFNFEPTAEGVVATGGPGFLQSRQAFGDFVARVQFTTRGDGLNSGVFFRTQPGTPDAPSNGYEAQISNAFKDGDRSRPADFGTGAIFRRAAARRVLADDHERSTMTIVAAGPRVMTWVNGYPVVDWTDEREPDPNPRRGLRLEPGRLSLQAHDPTTDVVFHRVEVAELPASD